MRCCAGGMRLVLASRSGAASGASQGVPGLLLRNLIQVTILGKPC